MSGSFSGKANPDGYADSAKSRIVGRGGEMGYCPEFAYRSIQVSVNNGQVVNANSFSDDTSMYCFPNTYDNETDMYIVITVNGSRK